MKISPNGHGAFSLLPTKKNNRYHSGIKQIPYVLRYGQPCRVGLSRMNLPPAMLQQLRSEEDLEEAMEQARVLVAAFNNTTVTPAIEASDLATTTNSGSTTNSDNGAGQPAPAPTQPAPGITTNAGSATNSDNGAGQPAPAPTQPAPGITTNAGSAANSDNGAGQLAPTPTPTAPKITTNVPDTTAIVSALTTADDNVLEAAVAIGIVAKAGGQDIEHLALATSAEEDLFSLKQWRT